MQLPKFSAIDLLYTDCSRASGAIFTYDGRVYSATGLNINGDDYDFDDVDRVRPTDSLAIRACEWIGGIWEDSEVLPDGAVDALCNFVPPAGLFRASLISGRLAMLRRARSYTPFLSRSSLRWYMPVSRDSNIRWIESSSSSADIARALAAAIAGTSPDTTDDKQRVGSLVLTGYSTVLSDTTTTLVGSTENYRVLVYSDTSCRTMIGRFMRDSKTMKLLDDPPAQSAASHAKARDLIPSEFFIS